MDLDETWQVGLRPEKNMLCTFLAKSRDGFRREREKMGRRPVIFVTCTTHHFYHFLWINFRQTLHNNCSGGISRQVISHSRKVSIKGSNFPKTVFLRYKSYPNCAQATGHGKGSATPRLFPSPGWTSHRSAVCLIQVTFAEGSTVFQLYTSEVIVRHQSIGTNQNHILTRAMHITL